MPSDTLFSQMQYKAHAIIAKLRYGVAGFRHPMRSEIWESCMESRKAIRTGATALECSELFQWTNALEKIPGDMAEVGTYLGGTAALMLRASSKRLHVFDTFEGLPTTEGKFEAGEWRGGLETVQANLATWSDRVVYHVGLFPDSAKEVESAFSFVHLDMDLYQGTKDALEWFWPRLSVGGAVLSHDYPMSEGVVRAFHDFFDGRPETFIPLSGYQCVAVKPR